MKNVILSTIAAAAFALSAGGALASSTSHDDGFEVFLQSQSRAPAAARAAGADYQVGTDNGFAVYQTNAKVPARASFLAGSAGNDDHIFSNNGRDAVEFRKTQEQGR
jgi:hypothetical protein